MVRIIASLRVGAAVALAISLAPSGARLLSASERESGGPVAEEKPKLSEEERELAKTGAELLREKPKWSKEECELLKAGGDLFRLHVSASPQDYPGGLPVMARAWNVRDEEVPEKLSEMTMVRFRSAFRVTAEDVTKRSTKDFTKRAESEIRRDIDTLQKSKIEYPSFCRWLIARFRAGKTGGAVEIDFTRRLLSGLCADLESEMNSAVPKGRDTGNLRGDH